MPSGRPESRSAPTGLRAGSHMWPPRLRARNPGLPLRPGGSAAAVSAPRYWPARGLLGTRCAIRHRVAPRDVPGEVLRVRGTPETDMGRVVEQCGTRRAATTRRHTVDDVPTPG